jgi:hypothetical protein
MRSNILKALRGWEVGGFLQKTSPPLSLMTTYRMSLIVARSISLDSTFKSAEVQDCCFQGFNYQFILPI